MAKLLEELKREHLALIDDLREVHKLGIVNIEGRNKLMSMKNILLDHMKKEDQHLYPMLMKESEKDENFKVALDFFASNMEQISKQALVFFDKYADGGNEKEFLIDYKNLLSCLTERIDKEEKILFNEFYKRGLSGEN